MLKKSFLISSVVVLSHATTMGQLFNGLQSHYQMQSDRLSISQAKNAQAMVKAQFWPKVNAFASYTHYSYPTVMKPISPTDTSKLLAQHKPLPISRNIARVGLNLSMPIYVKSLFTLAHKAEAMQASARAKRRVDLLKNEAAIVGANANWRYLEGLKSSLIQKKRTLNKTLSITRAQVALGRKPKVAEFKVKEGLNKIKIAINNIKIQEQNLKALIKSLTGITIKRPVRMRKVGSYHVASLAPVAPLRAKSRADYLNMKAQREKLYYPSVALKANYTRSYGSDYIGERSVHSNYSSVGVMLNMPLLDMPQRKSVQKAKLAYMKSQIDIKKTSSELRAKANAMREQMKYIRQSIGYAKENVRNEKQLLGIARASYEAGRMPIEEYLRYIDAYYGAKADTYKVQASYWQTLAQLAFVYGNNFRRIVK